MSTCGNNQIGSQQDLIELCTKFVGTMLCLNLNFWTYNSILMKSWNCKQISWMWTASGCWLDHSQQYLSNKNKIRLNTNRIQEENAIIL